MLFLLESGRNVFIILKARKKKKISKENDLVTYLLNKCNTGMYLWQDWRAGIMNGCSGVI